jgi:hypothetical protein
MKEDFSEKIRGQKKKKLFPNVYWDFFPDEKKVK